MASQCTESTSDMILERVLHPLPIYIRDEDVEPYFNDDTPCINDCGCFGPGKFIKSSN